MHRRSLPGSLSWTLRAAFVLGGALSTGLAGDPPASSSQTEDAPGGSAAVEARFSDATLASGIRFEHINGGTVPIVILEMMPPGAAFLDFDGDGDLDLYLIQSGYNRFPAPEGTEPPGNVLYRNDGPGPEGIPRFTDVTRASGTGDTSYGMGVAVADIDNDGDEDIYVTNYGRNTLYLNQGDGTFRDITEESGTGDPLFSASAAFGDANADGLVDLYVTNYVDIPSGPEFCYFEGIKSGCSDLEYKGLRNSLYMNAGPDEKGIPRFRESAEERGVLDPTGRGLGVLFSDLDNDGDQDLYVANDGGSNRLFINDGSGRFEDSTLISGTGYSDAGKAQAGMGADIGDMDGDGHLDIFVTNFARQTNALYRNDGGGLFSYDVHSSGISQPSFVPLGWGTWFFDAELDGDLDLFVVNGHVYDVCHLINPQDSFPQPNQFLINEGKGVFKHVEAGEGSPLAVSQVSRGLAAGDIDDDGDMDLYVANNGGPGQLLMNETPRGSRHALRLELRGTRSNRDALGARVIVEVGGKTQLREVKTAGSYLSSSDRRVLVGLGDAARAERVTVRWPSGAEQQFKEVPADRLLILVEGEAAWREGGN